MIYASAHASNQTTMLLLPQLCYYYPLYIMCSHVVNIAAREDNCLCSSTEYRCNFLLPVGTKETLQDRPLVIDTPNTAPINCNTYNSIHLNTLYS